MVDELPIRQVGLLLLLCFLALLVPAGVEASGPVPAWYYGDGTDGYLGRHPAAWWHGYRDPQWNVVNNTFKGVATGDWSIPFGTRLCIEVVGVPRWAQGEKEIEALVGQKAVGIVVGRMAKGYEDAIDCWTALFAELAGPQWQRIGRLTVEYYICEEE